MKPIAPNYPTLDAFVGNTPLVRLQRMGQDLCQARGNVLLAKLEGNNPAGSVKDRPALSMILAAEARGDIAPGDTLIEATSGNTGIALAMVAAMRGYRMILIMPDNMSVERRLSMTVYGAELILTDSSNGRGMEDARDLALQMEAQGLGRVLNQFANSDNPQAHIDTTGPEIWRDTAGQVSHFVSSMGTTGTITGTGRYLKSKNPAVHIIGVQPAAGSAIPGIRKWEPPYIPEILDASVIDREILVSSDQATQTARDLAREEGIFAGMSSGGAAWAALQLASQVDNATIVFVVCDRGDRYLSTELYA